MGGLESKKIESSESAKAIADHEKMFVVAAREIGTREMSVSAGFYSRLAFSFALFAVDGLGRSAVSVFGYVGLIGFAAYAGELRVRYNRQFPLSFSLSGDGKRREKAAVIILILCCLASYYGATVVDFTK